jgi:hypothetical protein
VTPSKKQAINEHKFIRKALKALAGKDSPICFAVDWANADDISFDIIRGAVLPTSEPLLTENQV